MTKEMTELAAEIERKAKWDQFLDAYSKWLKDQSLTNAASLRLAGMELETSDPRFSFREFEAQLGWDLEVEC